jgi:N-acetylmuramoyl-L-alanine amidase
MVLNCIAERFRGCRSFTKGGGVRHIVEARFMTLLRRLGAVATMVGALLVSQSAWHSGWAEPAAAPAKKMQASACDRAAFRVVVDVGHTAESPGAISARGIYEYDFNLRLASVIEQDLLQAGFGNTVLLVTDGPARKSLVDRVARANRLSPDLFLSIHHDSVPDSLLESWEYEGVSHTFSDRFRGHSIFISNENVDPAGSLQFGQLLGEQLKARGLRYTPHYVEKFMGHRQRILVDARAGVYRYDQLIVLRTTQMPAVLLEAGSIINRDEEVALSGPGRQGLISAAVVEAVDGFCAVRRPRRPDIARAGVAKPVLPLNAAVQSSPSSPKPR